MKLCINCKHKSKRHYAYCTHPSFGTDPVTGEINAKWCTILRAEPKDSLIFPEQGKCGPLGNLFEQRELTLKEKLLWRILKLK